jgi:hypothetical protein
MKRLMMPAAALALTITTASADGPNWKFTDPDRPPTASEIAATEAKYFNKIDPPQRITVTGNGMSASVAVFSVDKKEYVDIPPGTIMTAIMRMKDAPDGVCVLLPATVTKGLRAMSPSGCFWTVLK